MKNENSNVETWAEMAARGLVAVDKKHYKQLKTSNADMLEALKLVSIQAPHEHGCGFYEGIKCDCLREDLIRVVRAAIAKATGGENV